MAQLWEWEEEYILFQTAVMDESTAENKNRRKSAFPHHLPHMSRSVTLKAHHNGGDWNNAAPGETRKAALTDVWCSGRSMCT